MNVSTMVQFSDVTGEPVVKMTLPAALRLGDRLALKFTLQRRNGARTEELNVDGEFRVTSVVYDPRVQLRQTVTVESTRKPPVWRAVKNGRSVRLLGPTHFPPTEVR